MNFPIGIVINAEEINEKNLAALKNLEFNNLSIFFWETLGNIDIHKLADQISKYEINISSLSFFGNPLDTTEKGNEIRNGWKTLIKYSHLFGAPFVTGFAGRLKGKSIPDSISTWNAVFSEMLSLCYESNCKGILFENCRMGDKWSNGRWNIAINPDAWELMIESLEDDKLGLQWEPCHQISAFVDPVEQLKNWIKYIKHIHGKDGHIDTALLKSKGLYGLVNPFSYKLPGEGDTSWEKIIEILKKNNYSNSIDIELQNENIMDNLEKIIKSKNYLSQFE